MIFLWFIYGLAFFILGFGIIVYPKKGSAFNLAKHIWLIAAFGILHGINEWLDMFIALGNPLLLDLQKLMRLFTIVASFTALVMFGVKVIVGVKHKYRLFRFLPIILLLIWSAIFAFSSDRFLMGDIMARYLLCVPGTFLTALGLHIHINELQKTRLKKVIHCLQFSVIAFLFYGVVAGIIVKKAGFFPANFLNYDLILDTLGFPVQVFRIICAVFLSGAILYVLSVFHWETQQVIRRSEERFGAIVSAMPLFLFAINRDYHITFAQGNGLVLLDLKCDEIIGRNVSDAFCFLPQIEQDCRRAQKGEEFGTTFRKEHVVFDVHYLPLRGGDDEIIGAMCLALDVTARTSAQEQLDDYRREVEKNARLAEIGTLGSVMIGKLKDPLAVACLRMQRLLVDLESDKTLNKAVATEGLRKCLSDISDAADIAYGFQQTAQVF